MRIISGKFKGHLISFTKSDVTRPLKDSVKENIFNILTHSNLFNVKFENSKILDLYSGIGSFGLECLSRDVKNVTSVEKDNVAIKILAQNLTKLSLNNRATIANKEINDFLINENSKYDIFFLDPPFAKNDFIEDLKLISKNKIFNKKHIVIIHREKNSNDNFKNIIKTLVTKKYGRSKIIFGNFLY